ncbi:MAG: hypothetical protein JWQ11_3345 [Rhizobacter sp.]|nr:hypothetical protein [Rhizobacter sp.]
MAGDSAGAERVLLAFVQSRPGQADALQLLGSLLYSRGDFAAALGCFDASLASSPSSAHVWANRGAALRDLGRAADAVQSCERALSLDPRCREAWLNAGGAWLDLRRADRAVGCFDQAIGIDPRDAHGHAGRGLALGGLDRLDQAVESFDAALALQPAQAGTLRNRGNAHFERGDVAATIADYRAALALYASMEFLYGDLVHACMSACEWAPLAGAFEAIGVWLAEGRSVVTPFAARCMPLSASQLRRCADVFAQRAFDSASASASVSASASSPVSVSVPVPDARIERPTGEGDNRIRLGYFSADFREHVVAYMVCGLFERHDRERFEVFAFSFGMARENPLRERIAQGVDRFIDVDALTDEAVAALSRSLRIDIAIDLTGYTRRARPGVFACRAAPVQIGFLGDPGTAGASRHGVPLLDYLVADHTVVPPGQVEHYAERVVFMPRTYQVNSHALLWPAPSLWPAPESTVPARRDVGLPDDAFVFCAFHQARKITPEAFDVWMQLLREKSGSVLWLLHDNPLATHNLAREAAARGIDASRLVFAARTSPTDQVARLACADLFLDSFDYNAHATATDALWAGVPLVTRLGDTFASRVAASLLQAVGMPELIAHDTAEYFELALALARDPPALAAMRHKLAVHRETQPLFDTAGFTRHWEAGLVAIHQRAVLHLAPAQVDIRIKP